MIDSNSARIVVDGTGFHLDDWHKRARFTPEDLAGLDAKTGASGVLVLDAAQRVEDLAPWLNVLTAWKLVLIMPAMGALFTGAGVAGVGLCARYSGIWRHPCGSIPPRPPMRD